MRVLVTGGAGYIGSTLLRMLLDQGFEVICLDRLFFGKKPIEDIMDDPNFTLVKDDIRWFDPKIMDGVDVIVDLAALSNDPSGELDPSKTYDINYLGRIRVARLGKEYNVVRYIFASTCSVYGFQKEIVNENSNLNPLTTYAKSAALAEKDLLPLSNHKFSVTILRFATVYGLSYRMRFDLVVNAMVLSLFRRGKIMVGGDGMQKRPLVHVKDVCRAILRVIDADKDLVNGQIFNVGSNDQNFRILDLAHMIGKAIGEPYEIEFYGDPDRRSYEVDFSKIGNVLNYRTKFTVEDAAREIYDALRDGRVTDEPTTITVKWYKYLLKIHRLLKDIEKNGRIL